MKANKNILFNYLTENVYSVRLIVFTAIALTAIIIRLYLSFSHELVIGTNGGYYPLQVRCILNTGSLGFNDVPLYFYFCALVMQILSLLGFDLTNETIISVIKIIDCIALPLVAIPLFKIVSGKDIPIPFFASIAILLFAVFSFSPFAMLGDLQKNAFAIPFLLMLIYLIESYLINHEKRTFVLALVTLIVIALTHFGVFIFAMTFLIVLLFVVYRNKAILPSILCFLGGLAIISLFDSNRAFRLITFWNSIFNKRLIFQEPMFLPVLINIVLSYFLIGLGILQYRKFKDRIDKTIGYMLISLIILIFIFAFPLYEANYVLRFNALLFIPQSLLILNLILINKKNTLLFSISLILLTAFYTFIYFRENKKPCIDELAYRDLQNIKSFIPQYRDSTIIITEHGLEFWTAWALNVKVGNERAMDKINLVDYKSVIFLQPKIESGNSPHGKKQFHKPPFTGNGLQPMETSFPASFKLIYSSPYFNAYQNLN